MSKDKKDKYLLSSVYNTLEVLDLLSKHREISLSEISRELNLGKASVFRMLYTLEKKRFVEKTPEAKYKLGIKFAHYGAKVLERQNHLAVIRPYLEELRDKHNETVHLSVLDEDLNIIVIDKEESSFTVQMSSRVGEKLPGYASAMGKALMAANLETIKEKIYGKELEGYTDTTITDPDKLIRELKNIRKQGYAEDLEESEAGLICYAAPIKEHNGETVAAISFSGAAPRMKQNKEELVSSIKEAAKEISRTLGYVD